MGAMLKYPSGEIRGGGGGGGGGGWGRGWAVVSIPRKSNFLVFII